MFKELVVTALLSFATSSHSMQYKEVPSSVTSGTYLYGAYCIRNEIESYAQYYNEDTGFISVYDISTNLDVEVWANGVTNRVGTSLGYDTYYQCTNFELGYEAFSTYYFRISCIGDSTNNPFDTNNPNTYTFESYDSIVDWNNDLLSHFIIYFSRPLYVSPLTYDIFRSIFTATGNNWVTYYSGYYTFLQTNDIHNAQFFGSLSFNNSLYNFMKFESTNSNVHVENIGVGYYSYQTVIENSNVLSKNYCYIAGTLISNYSQYNMILDGVFDYVTPPTSNTDFEDLLFAVVDSPVYMLTQLFNFELLGTTFYVAFMSLATTVIIVFIIKKVV